MTERPELPDLGGVEHRFVKLPGLTMHVAEAGTGEPLLLLHGFPQHWWGWYKVLPALARRYRVIAPDLRGAGWTDAPADGYNSEQLVADVVALLDALELDRVKLMAHDWGALVGFPALPASPAARGTVYLAGDSAPVREVQPAPFGGRAAAVVSERDRDAGGGAVSVEQGPPTG